jgi:hypothetical protein
VVVVGEADPALELRVARQALLEAGHADKDDADAGPVEDVAQLPTFDIVAAIG